MRGLSEDRGTELGPERLKGGEVPGGSGEVGVSVEIALVAYFKAGEGGAEGFKGIGDFAGSKGGGCRSEDGSTGVRVWSAAAEVDSIEALPAGGLDEGGKGVYVAGGDLSGSLSGAIGRPDVAVDGVAADAEEAGADEFEEGDEVGVGGRKEVGAFGQGGFLVGEPGKGWADGADGSGRDG